MFFFSPRNFDQKTKRIKELPDFSLSFFTTQNDFLLLYWTHFQVKLFFFLIVCSSFARNRGFHEFEFRQNWRNRGKKVWFTISSFRPFFFWFGFGSVFLNSSTFSKSVHSSFGSAHEFASFACRLKCSSFLSHEFLSKIRYYW